MEGQVEKVHHMSTYCVREGDSGGVWPPHMQGPEWARGLSPGLCLAALGWPAENRKRLPPGVEGSRGSAYVQTEVRRPGPRGASRGGPELPSPLLATRPACPQPKLSRHSGSALSPSPSPQRTWTQGARRRSSRDLVRATQRPAALSLPVLELGLS
ncbi:hypothetical protein H1C71_012070 [Ictidomys tridecemlineatus]|nr:hypothetical protein H1C71_012070 [Ictidomys tridecemlineatus]